MKSSIWKWHKPFLFACVALAVVMQPVSVNAQIIWYDGVNYVLNQYEYLGSGGEWLSGIEFESNEAVDYQMAIYHNFNFDSGSSAGVLTTLAASQTGSFGAAGLHTVDSFTPVALSTGNDYFVVLGLTDTGGAGAEFPVDSSYSGGEASYTSNDYAFGDVGNSYPWTDLTGFRWALTPILTSDGPDSNIQVVGQEGDWSKDSEVYDGDSTLTVGLTATDDGPYDMEIEVTGGMDPITLVNSVMNESGNDWVDGYCLQLGRWLGDDFVLATGDLTFADTGTSEFVYSGAIANNDDWTASLDINLPAGDPVTFTLRQFAIPEPASFLLLTIAGMLLLLRRKR